MQILDVANAFPHWGYPSGLQPNFVCLCTLLPYTRTLRELRVKIRQTHELIWLAYAIFHPRSRQTRWDTLVIHGEDEDRLAYWRGRTARWRMSEPEASSVSWEALGWVASDARLLLTLVAADASGSKFSKYWSGTDLGRGEIDRVRQSAKANNRTTVYTLDRSKSLVVLSSGQIVELCDGSFDDASAEVRVLIPGYGFGWMPSSSLSPVETSTDAFPLTSVIKVLHMTCVNMPQVALDVWLRHMGPSLVHFRGIANWYHSHAMAALVPQLRSVDCWTFDTNTADMFSKLAAVQTLGVICSWSDLQGCVERIRKLHTLKDVRITIDGLANVPSGEISQQIQDLPRRLIFLRRLIIMTDGTAENMWTTETLSLDDLKLAQTSELCQRKLALLSVVKGAVNHPVSRLDAFVLSVIFSLCGVNLELVGHYWEIDDLATRVPSPRDILNDVNNSWFT